MMKKTIANGTVHRVPPDLRQALAADSATRVPWESLTPLARNEWICWVTFVKQDKTRKEHIARLISELKEGKRRPCCWIGCTHRTDKAISPSVRGILAGREKQTTRMNVNIKKYNAAQESVRRQICTILAKNISQELAQAESEIWHGAPVWFIDGNPVAGYSVRKDGVQLLFWSGQSFKSSGLTPEGSFKAAGIRYNDVKEITVTALRSWLKQAIRIQWDYKNIVKHKGVLVKKSYGS